MLSKFLCILLVVFSGSMVFGSSNSLDGDFFFQFPRSDKNLKEVNLLEWDVIYSPPPIPAEKYNRKKHFGKWRDFPEEPSCLNTRQLVLKRDSLLPIEFYPNSECVIKAGKWFDPYTDQYYPNSNELQIEHVVPLKKAYLAGAHQWTQEKRCAYFNYLGDQKHLIPIEKGVNYDKLDKGPEEWLPPNDEFHCEYIAWWLKIKFIWGLIISESEGYAINDIVRDHQCSGKLFKLHKKFINTQIKQMENSVAVCLAHPYEDVEVSDSEEKED